MARTAPTAPAAGPLLTGIVKRLVPNKGFGFIASGPEEYFFHRSAALDFATLIEGDTVTFLPSESPKGPRAEQVTLVDGGV